MEKLVTIASVVKDVLIKDVNARESDSKLILSVLREYGVSNIDTIENVVSKMLDKKIPTFASITRCKRKIVELYPELDGKNSKEWREQLEFDCIDFAINTKGI